MEHLDDDLKLIETILAGDPRLAILQLLRNSERTLTLMGAIMASLTELQDSVAAEHTVVDSTVVLLNGIAVRIAALELNQPAIDALAADVRDQTANLAAAVAAVPPA